MNKFCSLRLSSYVMFSSNFTIWVAFCQTCSNLNTCPLTAKPKLWHCTPDMVSPVWLEGRNPFPEPAGCILAKTDYYEIGPLCHKGTLLTHIRILNTFSTHLLSSIQLDHSLLSCCSGILHPRYRTWHLLLSNFTRFKWDSPISPNWWVSSELQLINCPQFSHLQMWEHTLFHHPGSQCSHWMVLASASTVQAACSTSCHWAQLWNSSQANFPPISSSTCLVRISLFGIQE